jgi:peptidylprolyl isomerase
VSDRVQDRPQQSGTRKPTSTDPTTDTARRLSPAKARADARSAKRLASKRAQEERARRRRAARRRRQLLVAASVAAGVLAVVFLVMYTFRGSDGTTTAGASATPSTPPTAASAAFPQLPAGADPALSTKPTVGAGSGELTKLGVTTLVEGKGAAVVSGQSVSVNYVGVTYKDGKEFDSSWKRSEPITFTVGTGNVIKGWDQGLVGVKVGSRVQLDIPSDLAYGDNPSGGQPGGALRFVVDVLSAT